MRDLTGTLDQAEKKAVARVQATMRIVPLVLKPNGISEGPVVFASLWTVLQGGMWGQRALDWDAGRFSGPRRYGTPLCVALTRLCIDERGRWAGIWLASAGRLKSSTTLVPAPGDGGNGSVPL